MMEISRIVTHLEVVGFSNHQLLTVLLVYSIIIIFVWPTKGVTGAFCTGLDRKWLFIIHRTQTPYQIYSL